MLISSNPKRNGARDTVRSAVFALSLCTIILGGHEDWKGIFCRCRQPALAITVLPDRQSGTIGAAGAAGAAGATGGAMTLALSAFLGTSPAANSGGNNEFFARFPSYTVSGYASSRKLVGN